MKRSAGWVLFNQAEETRPYPQTGSNGCPCFVYSSSKYFPSRRKQTLKQRILYSSYVHSFKTKFCRVPCPHKVHIYTVKIRIYKTFYLFQNGKCNSLVVSFWLCNLVGPTKQLTSPRRLICNDLPDVCGILIQFKSR